MKTNATTRRLVLTFGLLAASVASMANSAEPKAGDIIENSIKMKLAYIPPGEFEMGSPESEKDRSSEEKLHQVKLTNGFYLGAYEVTQAQFEKVLGRNPAWFSKNGERKSAVAGKDTASFPVEQVSWYDAVEFCNALSKSEGSPEYYTLIREDDDKKKFVDAKVAKDGGKGYRLPTEAEWEYACRAGTKTPFHFGDVLNGEDANVDGEFPFGTSTKGSSLKRPREVGSYAPNKFGLYDMHGNVWEWCNDWYGKYGGDGVDPKGPDSDHEFAGRVLRGGSFYGGARHARSGCRNHYLDFIPPSHDNAVTGFRVARTYPITLP